MAFEVVICCCLCETRLASLLILLVQMLVNKLLHHSRDNSFQDFETLTRVVDGMWFP